MSPFCRNKWDGPIDRTDEFWLLRGFGRLDHTGAYMQVLSISSLSLLLCVLVV